MHAAALNHRDFFLRQHLYPAPSFETPLLADGYGIVTSIGSAADRSWLGKSVILMPSRGWKDAPEGPESSTGIAILGGTKTFPLGTAQDVICVDENEVEEAPEHLSPAEAAALPLTGLTGWRALVTKSGNAEVGRNILVTGIGGGVALNVLQFGIALGANVYVTSGTQEKIDRARELGARGGVSYKIEGWEKELRSSTLSAITLINFARLGRWGRGSIWDDRRAEDGLDNGRGAQQSRAPWFNHGFEKGIQRYGCFCEGEEDNADRFEGRQRIGQYQGDRHSL
jgi:NADPH:quinone reductase-like Zn-dependent oxidoreductase